MNETRAQFTHSDLLALPTDPDRAGREHRRRGVVRHVRRRARRAGSTRCSRSSTTVAQQRGAHALRAGVDLVYNDDRITFPRAVRGSYTFSSLANFLTGTYNNAGFAQTFGETEVQQGNTNLGALRAGRVERDAAA